MWIPGVNVLLPLSSTSLSDQLISCYEAIQLNNLNTNTSRLMTDKCICSFWTSFKIQLLRHFDWILCVCLTSCFSWNSDMSIRMKPCIKERQNLVICPFTRSHSFQKKACLLTDLLNVFMHVSRHLLGQLSFTCKNNSQMFLCFYAIHFIKQ